MNQRGGKRGEGGEGERGREEKEEERKRPSAHVAHCRAVLHRTTASLLRRIALRLADGGGQMQCEPADSTCAFWRENQRLIRQSEARRRRLRSPSSPSSPSPFRLSLCPALFALYSTAPPQPFIPLSPRRRNYDVRNGAPPPRSSFSSGAFCSRTLLLPLAPSLSPPHLCAVGDALALRVVHLACAVRLAGPACLALLGGDPGRVTGAAALQCAPRSLLHR